MKHTFFVAYVSICISILTAVGAQAQTPCRGKAPAKATENRLSQVTGKNGSSGDCRRIVASSDVEISEPTRVENTNYFEMVLKDGTRMYIYDYSPPSNVEVSDEYPIYEKPENACRGSGYVTITKSGRANRVLASVQPGSDHQANSVKRDRRPK